MSFDKDNWPFNIKDLRGEQFIPELVVFHGFYHLEMVLLSKILIKKRIPYIIVPHGSLTKKAQQIKRLKKIIGNILLFNKFLKKAKAVQVLSKNEYQESKIENEKFIETNGINIPDKSKSKFSANAINFVYIGRIDILIKGLDLLFDAIIRQKEFLRKNNCKFFIYGPQSKDFYRLQEILHKECLQDLIVLKREVYGEEKVQALLNADIFIQTSRTEAMPMGILEALSYRRFYR